MTEEITSRLARVSGLGVISRNSTRQYKDTDKPTQQIGEELGIEYLLALIAKSSKHENAKQPHWAQARSSCWGTRSPPL